MGNEFLSQDEVDALLKGVVDDPKDNDTQADFGGVRPYKLGMQERIVRGRMPTLEIINDRFARLLRIGLFNFMRRSPDITVGQVRVVKYSEFLRNLVVPTNLNLAQVKPLRGNALFVIEPTLVFLVVDNMFGGDGRFHSRIEGRDFTPTEQRIILRMLQVVFDDYQKSWQNVFPLRFEYIRSEMHTQFVNIATPTEIVIVSTFSIELGSAGGAFHICIPYSTLEPIRTLIYSTLQGDHAEPDRRWHQMLARQVQHADVELIADLARRSMKLGEVIALKAGDVIPIDIPETIEARVDGVPVLECRFGELNGRAALRVEKLLHAEPDPSGEVHV
jgi:flagellar motor switch protein FliM